MPGALGPMGVNLVSAASERNRGGAAQVRSACLPGGIFGGLSGRWRTGPVAGQPCPSLIMIAVAVCVCACQDPRTHRVAGWTRVQKGGWANETRLFERRVARPQRVGTDFHDEGPGEEAVRDSRLS